MTDRSPQYKQGQRNAAKHLVTWLFRRAEGMVDPHARSILNTAATHMGWEAEAKFPKDRAGEKGECQK